MCACAWGRGSALDSDDSFPHDPCSSGYSGASVLTILAKTPAASPSTCSARRGHDDGRRRRLYRSERVHRARALPGRQWDRVRGAPRACARRALRPRRRLTPAACYSRSLAAKHEPPPPSPPPSGMPRISAPRSRCCLRHSIRAGMRRTNAHLLLPRPCLSQLDGHLLVVWLQLPSHLQVSERSVQRGGPLPK